MKSLLRTLIAVSFIPFAACDDYHYRFFGAVDPTPVRARPLANSPIGNFRADSTVVSITGNRSCGVSMATGETRKDIQWRVSMNTGAILLEQDLQNLPTTDLTPFSGVLSGQDFNAVASSNGNYLKSTACLFRGSTISGRFSPDFSAFDATEELTFGQVGSEVRALRHWVATRVPD